MVRFLRCPQRGNQPHLPPMSALPKSRLTIQNVAEPSRKAVSATAGVLLAPRKLPHFDFRCLRMSQLVFVPTSGEPVGAKQNPLWDKGFGIGCHRLSAEGTGVEPATGKAGI
jgi:hypothetical protein